MGKKFKLVRGDVGILRIYPVNSMKVECPIHGEGFYVKEILCTAGIRLSCGCEWWRGGATLEGWFKK